MTAKKPDLIIRSAIIRGEAPNKGVVAVAAANQHQMNRIVGFMDDGTKVVVAQRPGRGGMDFNKLMGGKVFAVAADGFSPVFEKDGDGKPTKTQKQEDGLPLYSASGFYSLSSKEYPALELLTCYTMLDDGADRLLMVRDSDLARTQTFELACDVDLDLMVAAMQAELGDEHNAVAQFDEAINKKRKRGVARAKEEAEDNGQDYNGVEYQDLSVSKKDGNPFLLYAFRDSEGTMHTGVVLREAMVDGDRMPMMAYFDAAQAMERWMQASHYQKLQAALDNFEELTFTFIRGTVMRNSVSFRRKYENVANAPADKPLYGDAVYIKGTDRKWTRGIVVVMHSMHPNFPSADYDAHHYVVAPRQQEVGMNKAGERWTSPFSLDYSLGASLLAKK